MGKNISHSSGCETVFGDKAQTNSEICMLINVTPEFKLFFLNVHFVTL